jgi:hypothetical protein
MATGEHADHSAKEGHLVVFRGKPYDSECLMDANPTKCESERFLGVDKDDPNKDYWGCVALWQAVGEQAEKDGAEWPPVEG